MDEKEKIVRGEPAYQRLMGKIKKNLLNLIDPLNHVIPDLDFVNIVMDFM